jgi:hypothetical protein
MTIIFSCNIGSDKVSNFTFNGPKPSEKRCQNNAIIMANGFKMGMFAWQCFINYGMLSKGWRRCEE